MVIEAPTELSSDPTRLSVAEKVVVEGAFGRRRKAGPHKVPTEP
jgi:hypothetical protein